MSSLDAAASTSTTTSSNNVDHHVPPDPIAKGSVATDSYLNSIIDFHHPSAEYSISSFKGGGNDMGVLKNGTSTVLDKSDKQQQQQEQQDPNKDEKSSLVLCCSSNGSRSKSTSPLLFKPLSPLSTQPPPSLESSSLESSLPQKRNSYLASELNLSSSNCRSSCNTNSSHTTSLNSIKNGSFDLELGRDDNESIENIKYINITDENDKFKKQKQNQLGIQTNNTNEKNTNLRNNDIKCDEKYKNDEKEGNNCDKEQKTSRPDSLSGVGRRYITRSSRTPVSASESSSSPSNTLLTSLSSSRTARLKSPLKSPSKSISPKPLLSASYTSSSATNLKHQYQHRHTAPSSTISTRVLGANDNQQQQEQQQQQQQYNQRQILHQNHQHNNIPMRISPVMTKSSSSSSSPLQGNATNSIMVQVQDQQQLQQLQLQQGSSSQSGQTITSAAASGRQNGNSNGNGNTNNNNNNSLSATIGIPFNRSLTSSNSIVSQSQNSSSNNIRTTKASRLRAAALDKKKDIFHDDHSLPHTPITNSYLRRISPRYHTVIGCGNTTDTNKSGDDMMIPIQSKSPSRRIKIGVSALKKSPLQSSTSIAAAATATVGVAGGNSSTVINNKKNNPSNYGRITTSLSPSSSSSSAAGDSSPQIFKRTTTSINNNGGHTKNSADCTVKIGISTKSVVDDHSLVKNSSNNIPSNFMRSQSSTMMNSGANHPESENIDLIHGKSTRKAISPRSEERDKSSKRKSNLNRALNEESTIDDDAASRRRRRRELGMARQLIPTDETSAAIRDILSPIKTIHKEQQQKHKSEIISPISPSPRNDLAFHMENARKEVLQNGSAIATATAIAERRRATTASPKMGSSSGSGAGSVKIDLKIRKSPEKCESVPITRSQNKQQEQEYTKKMKRLSDVSRKVDAIRERTKSELAEIKKITAKCNKIAPSSVDAPNVSPVESAADIGFVRVVDDSNEKMNLKTGELSSVKVQEKRDSSPCTTAEREQNSSSKPFVKKDRISFDDNYTRTLGENSSFLFSYSVDDVPLIRQKRILKARSHEREFYPDITAHMTPKLSPILRRKSSEEPQSSATNHIVSILKKKDYTESSSASSNSSPVTFSSSVVDTPTRNSKRQGILKKRSSLDESRYSRSHSPDERSILVKTVRRNSLEEIQIQHGILKQRSYESKSDGGTSTEPHGILKKKDSVSTPSDNHPKHVSISQAVILAAAELCKDIVTSENERDIKPILKTDSQEVRAPKPILKKKPSSETEEIRPILKTSRKSSREESEKLESEECVRPILKIDSPAKRRSLVDPIDPDFIFQRSRSLDNPDERIRGGIFDDATENDLDRTESALSVAERIKNMEKFISNSSCSLSAGAIPKTLKSVTSKRDMYKGRFKTQPVTVDEISCVKTTAPIDIFKPTAAGSLESLNQLLSSVTTATKISPRSLSSISPSSREIIDQYSPRSISDYNCLSLSSDSGLQTGRIFEMSGIDDSPKTEDLNSAAEKSEISSSLEKDEEKENIINMEMNGKVITNKMQIDDDNNKEENVVIIDDVNDNDKKKNSTNENDNDGSSGRSSSSGGLIRKNSVRARANMFQQLEEKMKQSSEDRSSPRTRTAIPRILAQTSNTEEIIVNNDLKMSQQDERDAEFEVMKSPSSPLSSNTTSFKSSILSISPGKSILKSKSGCVGFLPQDLSSELKNRLKKSTHATVSNLRKSSTVENAPKITDHLEIAHNLSESSSDSDDDGVDPQRNLAKILRSVSKENMHKQKQHQQQQQQQQQQFHQQYQQQALHQLPPQPQHDDTLNLVRNLSSLEKGIPTSLVATGCSSGKCENIVAVGGCNAVNSTSEGESSGGREISSIIKNSAVARRRKLNEGIRRT